MGRFDVDCPPRVGRTDLELTRQIRWDRHVLKTAELCACGRARPVECLCCGKILCFHCAGRIHPMLDLEPASRLTPISFDDLEDEGIT